MRAHTRKGTTKVNLDRWKGGEWNNSAAFLPFGPALSQAAGDRPAPLTQLFEDSYLCAKETLIKPERSPAAAKAVMILQALRTA